MERKQYIRKASLEDIDFLVAWGEKLHEVEKQYEPLLIFSRDESMKQYKEQLRNPDALFLIAFFEDIPVGYVYAFVSCIEYLDTDKKECTIEVIYLDPSARGTGLAQELIQACLDWAKSRDCFRIKAGIYSQNSVSQKLFSKIGFESYHTSFVKKF